MPRPPLLSSAKVIATFKRLGFTERKSRTGQRHKSGGSHLALVRPRDDGGHDTVIVIAGKRVVKRDTLKGMLETGNVSLKDFLDNVK